ncbi:DNA polymerase III subunit beta [Spiroplasma endosymbiont of Crioceris asparagi]|uniref:DNA polymerase III subunit beta n=1 Tax=Spiroplasma endosymbiont of Crioceris asparagi TaxID=3066286 RepID=UPI0030D3A4FD
MNFSINRKSFLTNLEKVSKIIDYKNFIPSLLGIVIEVKPNTISLITTNDNLSIKCNLEAGKNNLEIKEVGNILIKGKYILDVLRKMEDDVISLSNVEKNLLFISGKKSEFLLNLLDYEEFPMIGFRKKGDGIKIDSQELKKAINQTIISVNEYNQKIALTGLNFHIENNDFFITGTDNYRVSRKMLQVENNKEKFEANMPFKSAHELVRVLSDSQECKIIFSESLLSFVTEETIFQTTLLEGNFPNVKVIFPSSFNTTIKTNTKAFNNVIYRADIPNEENEITVINIQIQGNTIFVKSKIKSIGSFEEEFKEFTIEGDDEQNVFFNSRFLLDSLKTFETKTITIKFIDSKKPVIIYSEEEPGLNQIILPMFSN